MVKGIDPLLRTDDGATVLHYLVRHDYDREQSTKFNQLIGRFVAAGLRLDFQNKVSFTSEFACVHSFVCVWISLAVRRLSPRSLARLVNGDRFYVCVCVCSWETLRCITRAPKAPLVQRPFCSSTEASQTW
jgi:hypothetical protein